MAVKIQWLGHASFKVTGCDAVVYIDPWKLDDAPKDATIVCVSHSHYDHYSAEDIGKVSAAETLVIGPADVAGTESNCRQLGPGQTTDCGGVKVTGVASYNPSKQFHPKANQWLGFIIEIDSMRIYYAGDTDLIDEMKQLGEVDLALLPVGGTYTMDAEDAVQAVAYIKPKCAVGYHWGDIVGTKSDAQRFAQVAECQVKLLTPGQSIEISS